MVNSGLSAGLHLLLSGAIWLQGKSFLFKGGDDAISLEGLIMVLQFWKLFCSAIFYFVCFFLMEGKISQWPQYRMA